MMIYLIGSLRNPEVPEIANEIRKKTGHEVFDDWYAAGPEADDYWQKYETNRGHSYAEALHGHAARHVYSYDHHHLERADVGVLILPAGKSGHLELGFLARTVPCFILLSEGETPRWDVMYQFATVCHTKEELLGHLSSLKLRKPSADEDCSWYNRTTGP